MAAVGWEFTMDATVILVSLLVGATVLIIYYISTRVKASGTPEKSENDVQSKPERKEKVQATVAPAKGKKKAEKWKGERGNQFAHPHLITNLKGHSATVTSGDFAASGKYFISSAEDRTVLIWSTKDFNQREHKTVRGNISYDSAGLVKWSPDSKAFIVHKAISNVVEVYKVGKKSDGGLGSIQTALTFPEHRPDEEVIALGMALSGKFIMTCTAQNSLTIWSLRGEVLETVDTVHGGTYSARLSPCGRFIATTGFSPDVKVWEVMFKKGGAYDKVYRAFDLTGHKSGVYSADFSSDSSKMVSVSKDGTWRLYNTRIEYDKGQTPYLTKSDSYDRKGNNTAVVRLAPDGRTFAIAVVSDVTVYSAIDGDKLTELSDIYTGGVREMMFDPTSYQLLTLGDKHIRVFHNVAGFTAAIQDLQQSRSSATTAGMRERIDQQIKDAKTALENIRQLTQE